ncbi:hypothetical protein ACVWWN_002451 [Mycobacterium sp. URHB0021]|jgi:hypothetical protein
MGGTRGILVHQKPDHMDFNRLLNGIDVSTGDCPRKHLRQLCRLIFPDAVAQLTFESRAEEVRLQPMLQQGASRRTLNAARLCTGGGATDSRDAATSGGRTPIARQRRRCRAADPDDRSPGHRRPRRPTVAGGGSEHPRWRTHEAV